MQVNSFWWGPRLTNLEKVCISSFLQNGIDYNLYVYDEPLGVPPNVTLKDAGAILPRARVFPYKAGDFNIGSISGFTNLFRYTLINELGGWWTDTDHCCIRLFPCASEMYFQVPAKEGEFCIASSFFAAPAQSPVLRHCLDVFSQKDVTRIVHGETGPRLLTESVLQCGKKDDVSNHELFFPIGWWDYERLLLDETLSLESCFTVHFFNAMITAAKFDKDAVYPAESPFERLKKRFL